ncbi:MAG: WD40/YVTN/BNR-like repeat-containing protein [Gemmatimonadaceae bacterium]
MKKPTELAKRLSGFSLVLIALFTISAATPADWYSRPTLDTPVPLSGLVWRNIGPFRAGRVSAVSGVIGRPGTFYIGLPLGGVWKTTSAGTTWFPIFDSIKEVSSIGAVEVAPSDPNIIYVGTGDLITGGGINEGNGMYKSTDAGKTWRHLGLDQTRQIPSILVDPHNPNLVLIAAQGNVHAKSDVRGVYRSTDGGNTWTKTLYVDDSTGMQKIAWAEDRPDVILATSVRHYTPPPPASPVPSPASPVPPPASQLSLPASRLPPPAIPTSTKLYKSTDEGLTWKEITGAGLPALNGRTSAAVAMNTNAQRMFLIGNFGLYRSDDGGTSWRQMDAADRRVANGQGGYNCGVYVDPKNPDIVYTINTSSYKSVDGGNTFTGFKGAPGGDDPQQMWIDPTDGQRILLGLDQGATVSLDGGETWSSWYNQSTDQVYHISTDNSYPYWVYATQQDAGAIATASRGNLGEITPLDWKPVPGWEWGSIVADPLNPKIVYASGNGIDKITYPSEQWISVSPAIDPAAKLRTTSSQPLVWAPWNQHELLTGFQYLMSTTDGGVHWTKMSPDLTVPKNPPAPPPTVPGQPAPPVRDAIESISASSTAPGVIWIGTNNGVIQVTRDNGKTWQDVSIPNLVNPARADISAIDASHQDPATAYVAIDHHTTGDYAPHFYRTHDSGKTWTAIVNGLPSTEPSGSFSRVIRSDPKKAGLLFAGTESALYVSFDDGDHWQSLMFTLPNTSYRDIQMHGDDLIVGTYGRGIWILDDYSVLRQLTPQVTSERAHLFAPADAVRVRRNVNNDTPFPPEIPHALNAPEGAIIYYSLASKPSTPITLDVIDASGAIVRHMSSAPGVPVSEAATPPEPNFWIAPPSSLPANVGMNRANWDLRYDAPPAFTHTFEINANPGLTPPSPEGPLALPGVYTLKLTVDGRTYTQPLTVKNDPRSQATTADLRAQHDLQLKFYEAAKEAWQANADINAQRGALAEFTHGSAPSDVVSAAAALDAKLAALAGTTGGRNRGSPGGRSAGAAPSDFVAINRAATNQITALDNGDLAPTEFMGRAYTADCSDLSKAVTALNSIESSDLPAFNTLLAKNNLKEITRATPSIAAPVCR